jgi:phosphoglycerate kinase
LKKAKPTILKILEDGGVILMSHFIGRPKAQEDEFSLAEA